LLLESFSRSGFTEALIQKKDDIDAYLDTAWMVEISRGLFTGILVLAGAPLVADFFNASDAVDVVRVMAASVVISGFTNPAVVRFDRQLDFRKVFAFEVSQRLVEVTVAIAAAFIFQNVWALVFGVLAGRVARVVLSFRLTDRRPRLRFEVDKARELFRFGKWVLGSFVVWYFTSELDDILVGRILGIGALGLYRIAFTLSQAVLTEIAQTMNQVAFSAFSRIQEDAKRLGFALVQSVHFVALLAVPMTLGLVVLGEDITRVLLGEKWLPMVSALQVLALAGLIRALSAPAQMMLFGAGRPDLTTALSFMRLVIMAGLLYPFIDRLELFGAGLATLAGAVVADSAILFASTRLVGLPFGRLVSAGGWPMINGGAMAGVVLLGDWLLGGDYGVVGLFSLVALGVAAYALAVLTSWRWLGYRQLSILAKRFGNGTELNSSDV
ncbi:MAG: lipopolysaccharide biosynthesis protein, partial [Acidimicrobiia bacterium]|nr:lipopolysaccharide biosynthesis protein [Acidimicrobiia bacterium]